MSFCSLLAILFHEFMYLALGQYQTVLTTVAL